MVTVKETLMVILMVKLRLMVIEMGTVKEILKETDLVTGSD